jgi:hypothetical protein
MKHVTGDSKPTVPVLPEVALQEPIIITNNGKF